MSENKATLEIIQPGLYSTIQDRGRFGLRHLGIPWSGALCPAWQEIANALVGNLSGDPIIECFEGGLQLECLQDDILVAIVGDDNAVVKTSLDGTVTAVRPNRTLTLTAGEYLLLTSTGKTRQAVVAIAGVSVPQHLGSASTYAKASLGGLNGSALKAGDQIHVSQSPGMRSGLTAHQQCHLPVELCYRSNEIRVVAGPQFDNFSLEGQIVFSTSDYILSADVVRMGARFNGPAIEHRDASAKDIVSDAIIPGSIQIPGSGLPIVLLNDAQTAGGYPKIATVITTDLPLPGLQRAGATFRFTLVSVDEAIAARENLRRLLAQTIDSFTPCVQSDLDSKSLLQINLIDGVTDGSVEDLDTLSSH